MPQSSASKKQSWSFPHREKPQFLHVIVGVGISIAFCYALLLMCQPFLAESTVQLLSIGHIAVTKTLDTDPPLLILQTANGSTLTFTLTWQHTGIFSIILFCFMIVVLAFPLESSLWRKIVWVQIGSFVGLLWSLVRLSVSVLLTYHFGDSAVVLTGLVANPLMDFLWVIPVWSLGLSWLISARKTKAA